MASSWVEWGLPSTPGGDFPLRALWHSRCSKQSPFPELSSPWVLLSRYSRRSPNCIVSIGSTVSFLPHCVPSLSLLHSQPLPLFLSRPLPLSLLPPSLTLSHGLYLLAHICSCAPSSFPLSLLASPMTAFSAPSKGSYFQHLPSPSSEKGRTKQKEPSSHPWPLAAASL